MVEATTTRHAGASPTAGRALLREVGAERALTEEGWVVVPCLSSEEVDAALEEYGTGRAGDGTGFDTDFAYVNVDHKRRVAAHLRGLLTPHLAQICEDVQVFNTTYVVKWPGPNSDLPVHQDWSYVDESAARSASFWIPLVDVSVELGNGPVALLPGSHRLPARPRSANSTPWYGPWRDGLVSHLTPVDVPAGHALVFDNRILHASSSNTSASVRPAIGSMVAAAEVPLRYYYDAGEEWWVYDADDDFFVRHGPVDLRSAPPVDCRRLEVQPKAHADPPLVGLAELCGVAVADLERSGTPAPRLGGTPLEVDATLAGRGVPPSLGPLLEATRRLLRRPEPTSLRAIEPGESLAVLFDEPRLAATWSDAIERDSTSDATGLGGSWGPLRSVNVSDPASAGLWWIDEPAVGEASLFGVGGRFETPPRRCRSGLDAVIVAPVDLPQPEGTVLLQAGAEVEAFRSARPLVVATTAQHCLWSLAGTEAVLAVVEVADLGALIEVAEALALARRILAAALVDLPASASPRPVASVLSRWADRAMAGQGFVVVADALGALDASLTGLPSVAGAAKSLDRSHRSWLTLVEAGPSRLAPSGEHRADGAVHARSGEITLLDGTRVVVTASAEISVRTSSHREAERERAELLEAYRAVDPGPGPVI